METTHEHDENRPQQAEEHGHHDADHHTHGGGHAGHGDHASHSGHGDHGGHGGHGDHAVQFRRLFWIMLALSIPTVLLNRMFADLLNYDLPAAITWVSPILGTVIYFWGGRPFLTGAVSEIRDRRPGMMLLIGTAITVVTVVTAAMVAMAITLRNSADCSGSCSPSRSRPCC